MRALDGRILVIEVASAPITYEGSPAVLSFARDVTERKALERQVAESARLAALGRLSAGVAHELNNPLTHLVLAVDGLRRTLGSIGPVNAAAALAVARDRLDLIAQDIDRMVMVARELRLFASPQPGARRAVDLRQPLEAALRAVRDTHPAAARVTVESRFDDVPAGRRLSAAHRAGVRQPAQQRLRLARRRHRREPACRDRARVGRRRGRRAGERSRARASPRRCSSACSSRSSPPRPTAAAPGSGWPSRAASCRRSAAP